MRLNHLTVSYRSRLKIENYFRMIIQPFRNWNMALNQFLIEYQGRLPKGY